MPKHEEIPTTDTAQIERLIERLKESKRPGHGRIPAADYTGAKIVRIDHHHLKSGDPCPDPACLGRLHALSEPNIKLYLTGRPCVEATKYERSVLRCSGCDQRISDALP